MNEENENEVIRNNDENPKNNSTLLQVILTIIFVLEMMSTSFLFILYFILWLILKKTDYKDNVFVKAYILAFKIMAIILLVMVIAIGACFSLLFSA